MGSPVLCGLLLVALAGCCWRERVEEGALAAWPPDVRIEVRVDLVEPEEPAEDGGQLFEVTASVAGHEYGEGREIDRGTEDDRHWSRALGEPVEVETGTLAGPRRLVRALRLTLSEGVESSVALANPVTSAGTVLKLEPGILVAGPVVAEGYMVRGTDEGQQEGTLGVEIVWGNHDMILHASGDGFVFSPGQPVALEPEVLRNAPASRGASAEPTLQPLELRLHRADPGWAAAKRTNDALALNAAGDSPRAMQMLEEACETYPENAMVWEALGFVAGDVARTDGPKAADAARAEGRAADKLYAIAHEAFEEGIGPPVSERLATVRLLHTAASHHHALGDAEAAHRALEEAERGIEMLRPLATDESDLKMVRLFTENVAAMRARLSNPPSPAEQ